MTHSNIVDAMKVVGVNGIAMAISLSQVEAFLRVAAPAAALIYTFLKIWDWAEDRWKKRRARNEKALLELLVICLLLSGCTAPKISHHAIDGTRQVQTATVHIEKAKAANARAKESISTGKQAVEELKRTATTAQRPHVERLETSLTRARQENELMQISLGEVSPKLVAAQASIEALGLKLMKTEESARNYRRLKLWLASMVATSFAYIAFRIVPPVAGVFRFYAAGATGLLSGISIYFFL